MKTDLEFRAALAAELAARLTELGIRPSSFERMAGLAHNTFRNI